MRKYIIALAIFLSPIVVFATTSQTIDLTAAYTWTGLQTITNASTTALSAGSSNYMVNPIQMLPIYVASSTWGTGTTTITIFNNVRAFTFVDSRCQTDAGTLNVQVYHAQNLLNFMQASTTVNTNTFSTNNNIAAATTTKIDIGTAASSPTKLNCTLEYAYNGSS